MESTKSKKQLNYESKQRRKQKKRVTDIVVSQNSTPSLFEFRTSKKQQKQTSESSALRFKKIKKNIVKVA